MENAGNIVMDLAGKRVLVLSDNKRLSRAIELNLDRRLGVEVVILASSSLEQRGSPAGDGDFDLIVVAMSSPGSEPVVALARASLVERVGKVPLLIVSDRPFDSDPGDQIIHLDFPFDIDRLQSKVRELLRGES
jgi:DNA-binding response OmpR family regulator